MYKQDLSFTGSISADTSYASSWFWTGDATTLNVQIEYTSEDPIVGSWTLESSNAPIGTAQASIEPADTIEDSEFVIDDDTGSRTWNVADVGFNWVRAVFTYDTASPAQTVSGRIVLKGPMPA